MVIMKLQNFCQKSLSSVMKCVFEMNILIPVLHNLSFLDGISELGTYLHWCKGTKWSLNIWKSRRKWNNQGKWTWQKRRKKGFKSIERHDVQENRGRWTEPKMENASELVQKCLQDWKKKLVLRREPKGKQFINVKERNWYQIKRGKRNQKRETYEKKDRKKKPNKSLEKKLWN